MLGEKEKLRKTADWRNAGLDFPATSPTAYRHWCLRGASLQIPPFPGAQLQHFSTIESASFDASRVGAAMRRHRVGGSYWGAHPELPGGYVLVRSASVCEQAREKAGDKPLVYWSEIASGICEAEAVRVVTGECDPWHMLSGATALVTEPNDELCLIAALLEVPCYLVECNRISGSPVNLNTDEVIANAFSGLEFENPFTGEPMDVLETVELCGFWRDLIDSNRRIDSAIGFAFWKQAHVAPLLWDGSDSPRFIRGSAGATAGKAIAIWRAKVADADASTLEQMKVQFIEVEDGFLRSRGLGADCIPPLSITVDGQGAHFDPSRPSELEVLLEHGRFDDELLTRARELRSTIVEAGIGKYELGISILDRPAGDRRHILVPGQVEDDRAVQIGGCGLVSNLELLRRIRAQAPNAYILYKPHPDVLAGHRRGAISEAQCLQLADQIVGELPIASLIAMVDEVHVNTSLAGFEALLRGKQVTTYGVPFYAGWGLTIDHGPVPERRTRKRTIDELVAASLLLYPRYLDPLTGLPCPAEIVVARLSAGATSDGGLLVGMRRLQGKLMRRLRSLVQ